MKLMFKYVRSLMHVIKKQQILLNKIKKNLVCIAEALLEYETLSGEDIESLYNTGKMLEHHDGTLTEEPVQEVQR